ncbi:Mce protein [Mycolicibacter kumamotonensis]|uniref:Mce associated membrane protein n=1 Tax=Mycolicibacter kumamotonensis TaxID=354243 RepID=A0A1B8SAM6_9MYCO|nr:Mce protein [Mycolicibacter kumamotonensis]OBY29805.1 Mce associated membrane protein [Mycolicibacter kumamotonensis]
MQVPDGEDGAADLETSTEPVVETADGPDTVTEESPPAEAADKTEKTEKTVADEVPAARRDSRWRWVAAAVLALGLIGAAYEGWLLFAHHQREVAAAQALDAAEKYTLVLTGVDPGAIDQNFAEVLDGATGEFKDMYAASSEQLRQLLIENKAAAHGTVVESAVKSATKNKVEVLLFVDQSVSNKASPQAKIDRSRIVMTMEKVNGRWLAAKVDMP